MSLDAAQRAVADFADSLPDASDGRRILYSHRRAVARAVIEAIMEPDDSVLQAMHDGPLMADEHHMDDKTRAWLLDMWQTGLRALLAETGERGDERTIL